MRDGSELVSGYIAETHRAQSQFGTGDSALVVGYAPQVGIALSRENLSQT